MTISRRSIVSGAASLAALPAFPSGLLADVLTPEERRLMALVPPHVDPEGRAFILECLRDPNPIFRSVIAQFLALSPSQQRIVARDLELRLAETRNAS